MTGIASLSTMTVDTTAVPPSRAPAYRERHGALIGLGTRGAEFAVRGCSPRNDAESARKAVAHRNIGAQRSGAA
jgi:hypothetical protein